MTSLANALVTRENNIDKYVAELKKFPVLSRQQEFDLATRYRQDGDLQAAHTLVVSNLRFVVKVAHEFRGYGMKLLDLIQEGNIGLMHAVKKFDPTRGYRLISYGVWWIRAYMKAFVMRGYSQVKIGTTQAARKLFFKLRSAKKDMASETGEGASTEALAQELGVAVSDVEEMELRLAQRDFSLDVELPEGGHTRVEKMPSAAPSQEELLGQAETHRLVEKNVATALGELSDKERYIVEQRYMVEAPKTLNELGDEFGVSRERIRQLEVRALKKLKGQFSSELNSSSLGA